MQLMPALNELTVHEAAALLERGAVSSRDLVEALLDARRARDPVLRGYLELDEADARRQADEADRLRRAGRRGALLGVPLAVKDIVNVRGQSCRCASRILEGYTAPFDATVIARLRAEGALLVGRTNMDEFAMGSTTEHSAFGPTRNPWDPARVPGGSSGGSAAVVAADEALAALGTDTGGSVRLPAAFCGCVGLKPTYGRVSRYGVTAFASSLDQIGPLTRTVEDAALTLNVICGRDEMDATSADLPVPDFTGALTGDVRGLRIGLPKEYFTEALSEPMRERIEQAVDAYRANGAEIVEVSLPCSEYAIAVYYIICTAEASANLARFDGVRYGFRHPEAKTMQDMYVMSKSAAFGPEVRRRIMLGTYVLSSGYYDAYYLKAQKVRALIKKDFDAAFEKCDVIAGPTSPTASFEFGAKSDNPLEMYLSDIYTISVNLATLPGISIPCGLTDAGLPVGMQVIGPRFDEPRILSLCKVIQQMHPIGWPPEA